MKIEHFFFGMVDEKINMWKSDGVNNLISDQNLQFLRTLSLEDSDRYFWLPTEQVIALPHIVQVTDKAGRDFIQNHTLLLTIHQYLQLTNPFSLLKPFFEVNLNNDFIPIEVTSNV